MSNKVERSYDGQSLLDRVTTSISFIGAVGLILIAAAIVVDVLMRWLFNAPILGVDDLSIFILAVVVSSFFPLGLAKGHFVTIRFLGKALGPRSALWLEVFGGALHPRILRVSRVAIVFLLSRHHTDRTGDNRPPITAGTLVVVCHDRLCHLYPRPGYRLHKQIS